MAAVCMSAGISASPSVQEVGAVVMAEAVAADLAEADDFSFHTVISFGNSRIRWRFVLYSASQTTPPKMPTYLYCEVLDNGADGETIEIVRNVNDPEPTVHPETGRKLRRIYCAPNLTMRYSAQAQKSNLSNERLEKLGFTKYEKDKLTGTYNKVAGKDARAPQSFNPHNYDKYAL
jgi:predicted nucleic acid-binding Zn ribbon protein